MDYIKILGLFAALFITVANFPQTYKMIKTRSTDDISTVTYVLLIIGNGAWLAYGIIQEDLPLMVGNSISTLMCGLILFLKFTSEKVHKKLHDNIVPDSEPEDDAH
ncbi:MAG: hypothetical protein EOO50_14970 [Flavobacterium sp.]|uniref:SemiSWEET family sugar transporter n=1 Tax=Flavobacterium sp. TaxID=239 RepID=UPI00120F1E6D|nr:SemiSWEET family transporter [Flavobacterium sp.]RZJ65140.1 MAG: hypothetical protein EOO50_14970 [Flavobacterium sp.]